MKYIYGSPCLSSHKLETRGVNIFAPSVKKSNDPYLPRLFLILEATKKITRQITKKLFFDFLDFVGLLNEVEVLGNQPPLPPFCQAC